MIEKINIKLPLDLYKLAGLNSEGFEEKSRLIWILELYSEGKITLSKAANLMNMKIDQFLEEFRVRHLKHMGGPNSIEEAQEDLENIENLIVGQL